MYFCLIVHFSPPFACRVITLTAVALCGRRTSRTTLNRHSLPCSTSPLRLWVRVAMAVERSHHGNYRHCCGCMSTMLPPHAPHNFPLAPCQPFLSSLSPLHAPSHPHHFTLTLTPTQEPVMSLLTMLPATLVRQRVLSPCYEHCPTIVLPGGSPSQWTYS